MFFCIRHKLILCRYKKLTVHFLWTCWWLLWLSGFGVQKVIPIPPHKNPYRLYIMIGSLNNIWNLNSIQKTSCTFYGYWWRGACSAVLKIIFKIQHISAEIKYRQKTQTGYLDDMNWLNEWVDNRYWTSRYNKAIFYKRVVILFTFTLQNR